MRRAIWLAWALLGLTAGCGGEGSVFDTLGSPSSTGPTDSSATTTAAGSGETGEAVSGPDLLPPDPSTIISTEQFGEVFDRRVVVALADGADAGAADEVTAAVGGTVVASPDELLFFEIELPAQGEAALAAALDTLAAHPAVAVAAPSGVFSLEWDTTAVPCGPLDSLVLQGEDRGDQYRLTGVEDAWRLIRASGVAAARPVVGVVDGFGESSGYHGAWVARTLYAGVDGEPPGMLDAVLGRDAATFSRREVFGTSGHTSTLAWMAGARRAVIQDGATVVNLSLGGYSSPNQEQLMRRWLQVMARLHPEVLFVASAGNAGADVVTHFPGGLNEPNLVTVGGLDHQGERASFSNFVDTGGEVTLSVIADDVYTGMGSSGSVVVQDGTSFAAPQVTAAVAILQALDPTLTGPEIKQLLVHTAATEIANPDISDRIVAVDPALGGRVLRVDNAVWKVLSERLGVTGTREEVRGRATLNLRVRPAENDPLAYVIRAVAPGGGDSTTVQIATNGPGSLVPGTDSQTTDDDAARWRWLFFNIGESVQITLTRTDTGACARVTIVADEPAPTYAGAYEGTFDWSIPEAGFAATVPFRATVQEDGTMGADFNWSGSYDYGQGVQAQLTITGSCAGSVDAQGTVTCDGDFMGRTSVAGMAVDNPGTFSVNALIDAEGVMTGTIAAYSDAGGSGVFDLSGARVGG